MNLDPLHSLPAPRSLSSSPRPLPPASAPTRRCNLPTCLTCCPLQLCSPLKVTDGLCIHHQPQHLEGKDAPPSSLVWEESWMATQHENSLGLRLHPEAMKTPLGKDGFLVRKAS